MKRKSYRKYLVLGVALFLLVSLPTLVIENIRGALITLSTWPFKKLSGNSHFKSYEKERLEGENHLLRIEIGKLRGLLEQREKIAQMKQEIKNLPFSPKRCEEIEFLFTSIHQAVPARVIYRDPGSWSNALWVNVGEDTNRLLESTVIQKNSPVIIGRAVVGAVDYVGKRQSRIRLITDIALNPSVRAARGSYQNILFLETIDGVLRHLTLRDLPLSQKEKKDLILSLETLKNKIPTDIEGWYLAKGILQGAATPLFRKANHTLRGIGFNYDFPDKEGPARELVSGKVMSHEEYPPMPIIREGDLLVTTGMDGVFPAGLRVAEVTHIFPLKEGAYTYQLEAIPVVGNLDDLQTVFIIPPVGFSSEEQL